ncbi:Lrp/AsnC ligand binding domain-containing protein [Candidatus Sumerlaeota bacterium]|nr:Lrp/AsnC ligand binding domain-containing protein [Candidatus Sumerlaeota bacterium]
MITAIVLINAELKKLANLGDELAGIDNVAEVYSVTGDYDFVAIIRVKEYGDVADTVTRHIAQLDGVINTNTMLAFQCFSRYDMERIWSIGLEQ